MKIVIATTYVPFVRDESTLLVDGLATQLKQRGVEVDIAWLPFWSDWQVIPEQTLAIRSLDLTESSGNLIDRVITVCYPSYAIVHPNKVAWFIQPHRGAYDLDGTEYQDLPDTPQARKVRQMMIQSDTAYLKEHRAIYAQSQTAANRLQEFNGIRSQAVLYPPLPQGHGFRAGEYGDYFLCSGPLTSLNRHELVIRAMCDVKSPFRLIIAGNSASPEYLSRLENLIESSGLRDRVQVISPVSDEESSELTASAYGCVYLPYHDYSCGYPTQEAFHSFKPVITCTDSGAVTEMIADGQNGKIVSPTAPAVADAMEMLWKQRSRIRAMGEKANDTLRQHRVNWDTVVENLMRERP